jgi:hypothetical protein
MSSIFTYVQNEELQKQESKYNSNQRAFLTSVTTKPYKEVYDENYEYLSENTKMEEKKLDETYKNIQSNKNVPSLMFYYQDSKASKVLVLLIYYIRYTVLSIRPP